ncbi:MAG: APC family permease [Bacteroidota bacterium]
MNPSLRDSWMSPTQQVDAGELQQFGYQQELTRTMGNYSSFAISFSLISVLTGIYANFNFAFRQSGTDIIWSWLLVADGQILVALVMAGLSIRFPITGYGYQWSARLVSPTFGFFVGWLLIAQFLTGFPGICKTMAVTIAGLQGGHWTDSGMTILTLSIISVVLLIHLSGIKLVTIVNDIGVFSEVAGIILLCVLLGLLWAISASLPVENLAAAVDALAASSSGIGSFATSLVLGAWCLTGFEAAADLAEETHSPKRTVPRAIMISLLSASAAGFFLLLFLVKCASRITNDPDQTDTLFYILERSIGHQLTVLTTMVVLISIFACAVASMAGATRLIFSLSRDRVLPMSAVLSRITRRTRVPANAALMIWGLSCISIVLFPQIEVITTVSAIAAFTGYAGIMLASLISTQPDHEHYLGRWKRPVEILALVWCIVVVGALTVPETMVPGVETLHLPAWSLLAVIVSGILVYFLSVRRRINNHTAGPPEIIS